MLKNRKKSTAPELRALCRESFYEAVKTLTMRMPETLDNKELIESVKLLAQYGGMVSADSQWATAMRALESDGLSEIQKDAIIKIMSDESKAEEPRRLKESDGDEQE